MSRRTIGVDHPLNIGDKVVIERNGDLQEGIIKFMGKTNFKEEYDGIWLGIEVTDGTDGKNNGDFQGEQYFDCAPGKGVFVIRSRVKFLVEDDSLDLNAQSKKLADSMAPMRVPSVEFDIDDDDDEDAKDGDEPPPAPLSIHPADVPPPPKKKAKDGDKFDTKQITIVRGDENVTHNPLHSFNKPRYAAERQKAVETVEATNLYRGDIEKLATVEKIKLSDLDRDGTGQVNVDELQQVMERLNKYKYRRQMYINLCKGICVGIVFLIILLVGSMIIGNELTKPVRINQYSTFTDRSGNVLGTETFDAPLDPNFQTFAVTDKIEGFFGKYYINAEVAMVIQTQLNVYRFLTHQTNMEFILDRRENQDNLTLVIENRDGTISYIQGRAPVGSVNLTVATEPGADLSYNGTFNGSDVATVGVRRRLQSTNLDTQPVNFLNSRKWATVPEAAPGALNAVAYHIVCWSYNRDNPAARTTPRPGPGIELGTQASMDPPFAWRFKFTLQPDGPTQQKTDWFYLGSLWTASAVPRTQADEAEFAIFLQFTMAGSPATASGNIIVTSKTSAIVFNQVTAAWDPAVKGMPGVETSIELVVRTNMMYELFIDGVSQLTGDVSSNGVPFAFVGSALTAFSGADPLTIKTSAAQPQSNFGAADQLEVFDMELDCQTSIVADELFVWVPFKMNFWDAQTYCRNTYKSSLPSLKTKQENDAFREWFFQKDESTDFTWIGAAQNPFLIETEGGPNATSQWLWVDGSGTVKTNTATGVPNDYANWHAPAGRAPEPNQYSGNSALGENCAAMYGKFVSGSGNWLDTPCQGKTGRQNWIAKFACQKRTQSCYALRSMGSHPPRDNPNTYTCYFNPDPGFSLSDLQKLCDTSQTTNIADNKVSRRCVGVSYTTGLQTGGLGCLYFYVPTWDDTAQWVAEATGPESMFFENLCAQSAQPSPAPTRFPSSTPTSTPTKSPSMSPTLSPTMAPTAFNSTYSRSKVVVRQQAVGGVTHMPGKAFATANDYCQKVYGGYLFQPRTLAENGFTSALLFETVPQGQFFELFFWMGMRSDRPISFEWIVPSRPGDPNPKTYRQLRQRFTWTTNALHNPSDPVDTDPVTGASYYRAWDMDSGGRQQPDGSTNAGLPGISTAEGAAVNRDVSCGMYRWRTLGTGLGDTTFSWLDEDCAEPHDFICEVDPFVKLRYIPEFMSYTRAKQYTRIVYGPNAKLGGPSDLNEKAARNTFLGQQISPGGPFDPVFSNPPADFWLPISTQINGAGKFEWYEDNRVQHFRPMLPCDPLNPSDPATYQCCDLSAMSCGTVFDPNPNQAIIGNPNSFTSGRIASQITDSASFFVSAQIPITSNPSKNPSVSPTGQPSTSPSVSPTKNPSASPTKGPSTMPSTGPTTPFPTASPSTSSPIGATTASPVTSGPSATPTGQPSSSPTKSPSKMPTDNPTTLPPTKVPSFNPSKSPSKGPSMTPTKNPSKAPSANPSKSPTLSPSGMPSKTPTKMPSVSPTMEPTKAPNFAFSGVAVTVRDVNFVNNGGVQETVTGPPMTFGFLLSGTLGDPPTCRIVDTSNNNIRELNSYVCTPNLVANLAPNTPALYECDCTFDPSITSGGATQLPGARDVMPNTICAVGQLNQAAIDGTENIQPAAATGPTLRYLWDLSSETYAIFGMIYFCLFLIGLVQEIRLYRGHALKRAFAVSATHAFVSIMAFGYMTVCFTYASFTRFTASFTLATILALGFAGSTVWTFTAFVYNGVHLIYGIHWRNMGNSDGKKRLIRGGVGLYAGVLTFVFTGMVMAQIGDAQQNAQGFQTFNILAHIIVLVLGTAHAIICGIFGSWLACKVQTTADDDELTSAQQIDRAFSEFDEEDKPSGDALAIRLASVTIVFSAINLFGAVVGLIMAVTWPWAQISLSLARVVFLILPVIIQLMWLYFYFPTVGRAIEKARLKREQRMVDIDDDTIDMEETFQGLPLEPQRRNEADLKDDYDFDVQERRGTNIEFGAGAANSTDNGAFTSARSAAGSVGTGPVLDYSDAGVATVDGSEKKKRKKKKKKKNKKKKKKDRADHLSSGYGTADGEASREIVSDDDDGDFYEGPVATAEAPATTTPMETNDIPPQQQVNGMNDLLDFGNTGSIGGENERARQDTEAVFGALPTLPSEKHL